MVPTLFHSLKYFYAGIALLFLTPLVVSGQEAGGPPTDPDRFYLIVLLGQSNMVGDNTPQSVDRETHPRIFRQTIDGEWVPAAEPLHGVGTGPGMEFARQIIRDLPDDVYLGLLPLAWGGVDIYYFLPGGVGWTNATRRLDLARFEGTFQAILYHQGESDSGSEGRVPFTNFVSSQGLPHLGDFLHFGPGTNRLFGQRFATAYRPVWALYEGFLPEGNEIDPMWFDSWFGIYQTRHYPWIFHLDHGFLFAERQSPSTQWFFDPNPSIGWFYTTSGTYPNIYSTVQGSWLYYYRTTENPRVFYNFSTQSFLYL